MSIKSSSSRLWYERPAQRWLEALPIGNGRLGAMVFGGIAQERIQFNEESLWSGGPGEYVVKGAAAHLPELRRLIFEGKATEAETLAARTMMPLTPGSEPADLPENQPMMDGTRGAYTSQLQAYLPMGDLFWSFPDQGEVRDYRRELDLDQAVARVGYTTSDGNRHEREVFASYPANLIAMRLKCDRPGGLNVDLALTSPHPTAQTRAVDATTLCLTGQLGPRHRPDPLPFGAECDGEWDQAGLRFEAQARVRFIGGSCQAVNSSIQIRGAEEVVVLLAGATSYMNPKDISADPHERVKAILKDAARQSYTTLREAHTADHQRLFHQVELALPGEEAVESLPTDQRIARHGAGGDDPALAALLFDYGRYLLIASSRPGTLAAPLQGLWNEKLWPAWGAKWTLNVNTQMNYWAAEMCGLGECHQPLFDLIQSLVAPGRRMAKEHYGCGGFVVHHNTDLWRATGPVDNPIHLWPMGAAWLCLHLWEHYQFTNDLTFLRERGYPVMKEAAAFLNDFLIEAPPGVAAAGHLVSNPSMSPENSYHRPDGCQGLLTYAATMDLGIIRELLGTCIPAAETLGVDAEAAKRWRTILNRLPPYQIGRLGQLQEWIEDWDDPDDHHRHAAHLFALHPGSQITRRRTPELAAAAERSLELRGDDGTGWALVWKMLFWARLHNGERSGRLLRRLLRPAPPEEGNYTQGGVYPNLFDAHPPFQIDGNFGATAAICEMLLQSHERDEGGEVVLELLAGLPKAWTRGWARRLRARGGLQVDLNWNAGELSDVKLHAAHPIRVRLRAAKHEAAIALAAGRSVHLGATLEERH